MKRKWIQKCDVDQNNLPIPTQIISTEEFAPPDQTVEQKRVEQRLIEIANTSSSRLGISRRKFLAGAGGMAAAFLAMNEVFGNYFDVSQSELYEPRSSDEKFPKRPFIFDIHTHHVGANKIIQTPPLIPGYRNAGGAWGNTSLVGKEHKWEDLYLANYIKEMFFDSDTSMAVITGLPAKTDDQNVLTPSEMFETRAEINGLANSKRLLSHGTFSPDLGRSQLESMARQFEQLKPEAWKGYPGQPLADGSVGWWMDDEKIAYPFYEYSRKIGIRNICVHKGLPLPGWELEHSSPRDVEKAAKDFPDLNFLIYHAGFKGVRDALPAVEDDFKTVTNIPWITDLCEMRKRNPRMKNVYMDLGTTFGMTVITQPKLCAYMLGLMIQAFGEEHVLWGTDSIWWGSPQWQIEAFRRLQMPEDLQRRFKFKPLTDKVKAKIFGLNSARVYGIDVKAKMNAIPTDHVTKLKAQYQAQGASPSNTQYGWIRK
ncbi:MAG: amidohydrolase family protein [Acidobacteria bacterium]|nr:amidohydrolase family protein [Acidobacteriota bacterium]